MSDESAIVALAAALEPLVSRVRTDVTAVKKATGEQAWTRQPLTPERLARHLNGGPPRGVSPIKSGEDVTLVAMLDFDSHGGEVAWDEMSRVVHRVAEHLELLGYDATIWRSSGGRGVHLYLMWDEPQSARAVRRFLAAALSPLGLRNGTGGVGKGTVEIFPKQDKVPEGGFGNQFILPLANRSELLRWEDLLDEYVPVPRSKVAAAAWVCSPPVPSVHPDSDDTQPPPVDPTTGEAVWRAALDAIPNKGEHELDYDVWRNVVFAIHHETGGSDAGLALAHEFSKRSGKHDPAFLDNRVWPYITSERGGHVVTGRTVMSIASRYGWFAPIDDEFEPVPDPDADDEPAVSDREGSTGDPGSSAVAGSGDTVDRRDGGSSGPVVGQVPAAQGLTTDQANANRLVRQFGRRFVNAAGRWLAYDNTRWAPAEADVYRYGSNLSRLITEEAKELERVASELENEAQIKRNAAAEFSEKAEALDPQNPQRVELQRQSTAAMPTEEELAKIVQTVENAQKLHKWASKSEMKGTIEAAVGLLGKMVTIDPKLLDSDPMLMNCANGTIDLTTGMLRPHRAKDYITKIVPVDLMSVSDYDCSKWEQIVRDIAGGEEIARFLQRWFGYCATGSVREQVLVVHWGSGRNGKSTILSTMGVLMGGYAGVAAPGLLTGDGKGFERHPTEVASLLGKRMVVAHESEEGAVLREGFVKQATGGDTLTGRYMREDFFEFDPTHKLQLLTNHKPAIKGTDPGIWRRVLLVPYLQSFGTAEQLERGEVTQLADKSLGERIKDDPGLMRQVLVWVVRGAMEWAEVGLNPPVAVLSASREYKEEQDRVGQFVRECCELPPASEHGAVMRGESIWSEPITQGMDGLYPTYQSWAKDSGFFPLSRQKFIESLRSAIPVCHIKEMHTPKSEGKRRKVTKVFGIRLLQED